MCFHLLEYWMILFRTMTQYYDVVEAHCYVVNIGQIYLECVAECDELLVHTCNA